jgi:acyl-CoA thioester hydrolase
MTENTRDQRIDDFPYRMSIPTRWGDNDMLGHVNNVIYYRFFEAIAVRFLTEEVGVDWSNSCEHPNMVESLCRFHRSLKYPDVVEAGLRVEKIGTSSVTFTIAVFGPGHIEPAATGHVVEVFVNADEGKSVPISAQHRVKFEAHS